MTNVIVEVSKFLMMILFALYTFECFAAFRGKISNEKRARIFKRQVFFLYLIHLDGYLSIYAVTDEIQIVILYFLEVVLITVLLGNYQLLYPNASRLVTNNMCMLLVVGFLMLTRLSYEKAIRQYIFAIVSTIIIFVVPVLIRKAKFLRKLTWLYAVVGIAGLAVVTVFGNTSYGAKISITIGPVTLQPSEFVKLVFVFFVACMLHYNTEFKQVCITTVVAASHVLILVASRDLGGALIFFITYLVMLYVATRKLFYFAGGILAGCIAAVVAYQLFSHVRVRVLAWSDPLSVIDNEGYQICQSLFAIGTGGWFGTGLYQGTPNKIPVVEQDFIFSAISEEMGGIFALCLIMVCVSCFLMFLNIAMQMKDQFYKLVALGLGTVYAFQVFLTIGGVTKFIPSTGVTLPLVSYGGSSLVSTMILFAVIQGLYILRQDEGETNGKQNIKRRTRFDEEIEDFS